MTDASSPVKAIRCFADTLTLECSDKKMHVSYVADCDDGTVLAWTVSTAQTSTNPIRVLIKRTVERRFAATGTRPRIEWISFRTHAMIKDHSERFAIWFSRQFANLPPARTNGSTRIFVRALVDEYNLAKIGHAKRATA